jgi:hypothetical protein
MGQFPASQELAQIVSTVSNDAIARALVQIAGCLYGVAARIGELYPTIPNGWLEFPTLKCPRLGG